MYCRHKNDGHSFIIRAAESLANQVTEESYKKGMTYPSFTDIRKISANIAANVAAKAYELGVNFNFFIYTS
jgi:malate dehydrogenase (oxaloacetate-decarboxylating)(NADP+)